MARTETHPWDATVHLKTEEDMAAYLEATMEDGEPALVAAALGDIARAKGMGDGSVFDVDPVNTRATTQDILDAIRESRERE